jgi:hypothetical protein
MRLNNVVLQSLVCTFSDRHCARGQEMSVTVLLRLAKLRARLSPFLLFQVKDEFR